MAIASEGALSNPSHLGNGAINTASWPPNLLESVLSEISVASLAIRDSDGQCVVLHIPKLKALCCRVLECEPSVRIGVPAELRLFSLIAELQRLLEAEVVARACGGELEPTKLTDLLSATL